MIKASAQWADVVRCAHQVQQYLPEAVPVGGFGAAIHAGHRVSIDVDSVLRDLTSNFDQVLSKMQQLAGWKTARTRRPVLILGRLLGVEVGLRQLRRSRPLETEVLSVPGIGNITVPTSAEMLRTKAYMVSTRNAVRDYVDVVAMADLLGPEQTTETLAHIGEYYPDQTDGQPLLKDVLERLAMPTPTVPAGRTPQDDLARLRMVKPEYGDWRYIESRSRSLAVHALLRYSQP